MKIKRALAIIMAILLLSGCKADIPTQVFTRALPISIQQSVERGYLSNEGEHLLENAVSYRRSDGNRSLLIYAAPFEKSGNVIGEQDEPGGNFLVPGTYVNKYIPEQWSDSACIHLVNARSTIDIYPADDERVYSGIKEEQFNAFGDKKEAIHYEGVFGKGTALNCYITSFGVNLEIVLNKRPETNNFRLRVRVPTLIPDSGSPDYVLFKKLDTGDVCSLLYTPLMVDKKGKWDFNNTVTLVEKDAETGIYTVEYTVDEDFLEDTETAYPVKINQSMHIYHPKQPDTSAYSDTGEEAKHYLSPYMFMGDSTIKGEGWTFIRYEALNQLEIDEEDILSAKYYVRNLFDLPSPVTVGAYAVTADWCSINTRWFNRPPFDEHPVWQTVIQEKGDYSFDITALLKTMIKNKDSTSAGYSVQNSFMIRSDTPGANMLLASGDNGLFSPVLEIVLAD